MMAGRITRSSATLGELVRGLGIMESAVPPIDVNGLALDSRVVRPGDLFLACPGVSQHGMAFIDQAVNQGAVAVVAGPSGDWPAARIRARAAGLPVPVLLVQDLERQAGVVAARFFGHPSRRLQVTGITGTNGKTSCAHFLAQALVGSSACALIGTLGNGFPGDLRIATHTTPDAVQLQAMLADYLASGASDIAMEVSSHALHQHRVAGVDFDIAVFTNLSRDHLDYHESMAAYGDAKARLFAMVGLRAAVINANDPFGGRLLATLGPDIESVAFGASLEGPSGASHWLSADRIELMPEGLVVQVNSSWGQGEFRSPVLARFNALNLLAVLGVLLVRGMALPEALRHLGAVRGVPGRMEHFATTAGPAAIVDYAHTPDALEQVLMAAREHCRGRILCVFGCGGDRDRGKRALMGAVAERLADQVVLTDDNPRREDGDAIIADILAGMDHPERVEVERNRGKAISEAISEAGAADWVVVAGKGHETVQQIGDLTLPFSDREAVRQALEGVGR